MLTVLINFLTVLCLAYSVQYFNQQLTYRQKTIFIILADSQIKVKKYLDRIECVYEIE